MTMSSVCEFPQSVDLCYGHAHGYLGAADPLSAFTHTCWGLALGWCWECRNQYRCRVWSLGLC